MAELPVRVTPNCSQAKAEWRDGSVRIWVSAKPHGGEANEAACEVLAKRLGISKSSLEIIRGHTSRQKLISVEKLTLEEVEQRLRSNS